MVARKSQNEPTEQERTYVKVWIETGSMSKAYKKAYNTRLKGKALNASAKKVARRTPVRLLYEEMTAKHQKRHEVTVDRVVSELSKLAFANMLDYMQVGADGHPVLDFSRLTRDQAAAISELTSETVLSGKADAAAAAGEENESDEDSKKSVAVLKTKFKLHDKKVALDSLGKHLGIFKDVHEHTGKGGGPIETKETGFDPEAWLDRALAKPAKAAKEAAEHKQ